jgi:hypothetical protein
VLHTQMLTCARCSLGLAVGARPVCAAVPNRPQRLILDVAGEGSAVDTQVLCSAAGTCGEHNGFSGRLQQSQRPWDRACAGLSMLMKPIWASLTWMACPRAGLLYWSVPVLAAL